MSSASPQLTVARADRVGVWLSTICATHCLVTPFAMAVLPFLAVRKGFFGSLEWLFVVASIGLATVNLCWGLRIHQARRPFLVFGAAVTSMIAGRCLANGPYEIALVTAGALGITAGHLLNRHLCLHCAHCEHHARPSDMSQVRDEIG